MVKTSLELMAAAPYNFDLQWRFYYSSKEPQPEIFKDGIWSRAFRIGNKLVPVAVTATGTIEQPELRVDIFAELNAEAKRDITDKLTDIFRLREDLSGLYKFMDREDTLRRIKNELYGLRPPGIGTSIFEGAIRVIEDLRACKLSRQKSRYIKAFTSEVASGYDLGSIKGLDNERAIEELMKFNGIGRWTAEMILITTLGRMDLCVPDDLGARKAVSYFYFDGELQSGDVVRKFTERWGRFKGWIIYYLICAYNMVREVKEPGFR